MAQINFPTSVDVFDRFVDPSPSDLPLIQQYKSYINNGDLAGATAILNANPQLKRMIANAENLNQYLDAITAIEQFYLNDVQNYLIELIKPKGDWNSVTKYTKYDVVQYTIEGAVQSYMGVKVNIPIGTLPTDTNYFTSITLRGAQGESGTGMSPRGAWNSTIQYYQYDCVPHNNVLWYAKRNNLNKPPQDISDDWGVLMSLPKQITTSPTQPVGQETNDIWYEEVT